MFQLFQSLAERVKALFITHAALDFEAEFCARDAERKAELLRQAARYEDEGLHGIAQHLRQQADALCRERPLAGVLPSIEHLCARGRGSVPLLAQASTSRQPLPPTRTKRKGR